MNGEVGPTNKKGCSPTHPTGFLDTSILFLRDKKVVFILNKGFRVGGLEKRANIQQVHLANTLESDGGEKNGNVGSSVF